ncbi:MAG: BrxA family protein [Halioglobus sp.]|nr:BrxA family protein [Halioglobus sp.]
MLKTRTKCAAASPSAEIYSRQGPRSAAERTCREAIARLTTLKEVELVFLADTNHQDQAHLLWIAVCRLSRFYRRLCRRGGA